MIKWGATSRWSLGPNSAWSSIETMIIGKTHPTLLQLVQRKPRMKRRNFGLRIWITKFLDEPSWGEIFEFSEFLELFENLSSILSCKKTGFYATCFGHINVKNHKNLR